MSRVREIPSSKPAPKPARVYERFASSYGPFRSQVSVFAHVPSAIILLMELKLQANIGACYIELGIVTVLKLNQCHYCVWHHTQPLMAEGIASETIALLPEYENNPGLDAAGKLVVEYAAAVTENAQRTPDRLFDGLRAHLCEAQVVELTMRIALAGFFNRFNDALQITDELGEEVRLSESGEAPDAAF